MDQRGTAAEDEERLGRVQSLVRAFAILDELSKADGVSLSEIARAVHLPRSTTHRLLTTMQALDFATFDRRTNDWSVGMKAFTVGAAFAHTRDFGRLGRPIMRSLMTETHHSVNIAVPEKNGMCYVGQVAADGVKPTAARPGACLPMHTTASGKVMMAHWAPAELDRFIARNEFQPRTPRSIVCRDAMRHELDVVRDRGFAIDDEEQVTGLRCVAAVVLDRYGMPKASLSVSDVITRLKGDRLHEIGQSLVLAARQMSSEIADHIST